MHETAHPPHPLHWSYRGSLAAMAWPAIPNGNAANMLALLQQMDSSQWLAPPELRRRQFGQLELVLQHAFSSSPWYRKRWDGLFDPALPLTPARLAALPLLTRRDLQENFDGLTCRNIPPHGAVGETSTTGSTGTPVRVLKTELCLLLWDVFTLRDEIWHRRDLLGKLAMIRHGMPEGEFDNWGRATTGLAATGPLVVLGIEHDVGAQLAWLQRQQPEYLMTHPSLLAALLDHAGAAGVRLESLRQVRTFGEPVSAQLREQCRATWGAVITDAYSSNEVGYIALQCPEHDHYHVQSEDVLVEILDEGGRPCKPGELGRVVITTLHNFAMPLVRYDIGDYAEPGEPCACGRGLPVIQRIVGRTRNMLVTAEGKRFWVGLGSGTIPGIGPIRQYQFVQTALDHVEARLVVGAPLTPEQESRVRERVLHQLPAGFTVTLAYRDTIARGLTGKFEDFLCEIAVP